MVVGRLIVVVAALSVGGLGCDEPAGSQGDLPSGPAMSLVLSNVATDVVGPALSRFQDKARALSTAEDAARQGAWLEANAAWQGLAVMQFGPAGPAGLVVGGRDLAAELNSWPLTNECRVDQETAERGYEAGDFFAAAHVNVYGLDALEYLLFAPSTDTVCNALLPLVKDGIWAAIPSDERVRRRLEYARRLGAEVARQADALAAAWATDAGDWGQALKSAGQPESPYAAPTTALNDVLAGLFYVDTVVKDLKIAKPAGLLGCSAEVCPDAVEAPWSGRSTDAVLANLASADGLVRAFGPMLEDRGAESLGDELLEELGAAQRAVREIPGEMQAALAQDPAPVRRAHAAIKRFTDLLKGPFVTVLSLSIPDEGAGDND